MNSDIKIDGSTVLFTPLILSGYRAAIKFHCHSAGSAQLLAIGLDDLVTGVEAEVTVTP
jgi:hypothetical protein